MFPNNINNLIENFKKLPGIGQKSAERLAFSVLKNFDSDDYDDFSNSLISVRDDTKYCSICNVISETDVCNICSDNSRNHELLIVVENSKDVFSIEKLGNFNGYYHVLDGLISPFDDITPDDINLESLFDRVKNDKIKELIFVTRSGVEADTTILYIKKMLEAFDIVISRVANGIPIGADMDYIDTLTLESALNNRKQVLD